MNKCKVCACETKNRCGFCSAVCEAEMADLINRPPHYTVGKIETIETIEDQGHGRGFCYGNAIKYLCRAPHKGTEIEDLKKAVWYVERLIKTVEKTD